MIKIENLSRRQKKLLDIMWSIETQEELVEWVKTLNRRDAKDVIVLIDLVKIELIEEIIEDERDFTASNEVIETIKGML